MAKMKVHRIEAALKVADPRPARPPGSTRIHFDGYLIQFAQAASVLAIATTSPRGGRPRFASEVEQILRTIQLDPANSGGW